MRVSRAVWRAAGLLGAAALVTAAQQLGWTRVGHFLAAVAAPVGRVAWAAVKAGWPFLLALGIWLLTDGARRAHLAEVVAAAGRNKAARRWLAVAAGVIVIAGLLVVVLVTAPPWFVRNRSLEESKAQNDVRTTLLQGLGGVVLLVGAYFTYRQVTHSREQLAHSREQLQVAQQGQITERFTRAIDQLGHAQLDVRLGGIYALERIARDSLTDRATIGEVVTAFIRSHAPWPPSLPGQYVATAPIDEVPELQVRAPDVQACLTVLGRGGFAQPRSQANPLDLHSLDLRQAHLGDASLKGANLSDAHLERADLTRAHLEDVYLHGAHLKHANLGGAHLEDADLAGAHLRYANLSDAHLERANLTRAHLEDAFLQGAHLQKAELTGAQLQRAYLQDAHLEDGYLFGAHLEDAYLRGAQLQGASLSSAQLQGASLSSAHLEDANLCSAHLEDADLGGARLTRAVADQRTRWPSQFDWLDAGVIGRDDDDDTAAGSPSGGQ